MLEESHVLQALLFYFKQFSYILNIPLTYLKYSGVSMFGPATMTCSYRTPSGKFSRIHISVWYMEVSGRNHVSTFSELYIRQKRSPGMRHEERAREARMKYHGLRASRRPNLCGDIVRWGRNFKTFFQLGSIFYVIYF